MAIRFPTATRNVSADAAGNRADGGAGPGTIQIRSGAQPGDPNAAASGTLLATVTCADPAWGAASSGSKTLAGVPLATTGAAAGTAGWFRMLDSNGASVMDGSVTVTGGGGDLTLNTTTISIGVNVSITGGTLTQPAG